MFKTKKKSLGIFAFALLLGLVCGSSLANAQMENNAWQFKVQNRASLAALMRQVENEGDAAPVAAASGFDQLVCGGDGQSSATANSSCIILNNSDGSINIGQDSDGDQDATNTEETTMNNTMSEVLETIEE